MLLNEVKRLVGAYSKSDLEKAVQAFEASRENTYQVEGKDDGEKLSNLLAAVEVRTKVEQGTDFNLAIREFSQRVRAILKPQGFSKNSRG